MQFLPGHSRPTFILLNAAGRIDESSEEYYLRTYQLELRERDIRKLSWEQHVNLPEPSFLVPMNVNPLPTVEEDVFSCLVLGRNAIALYSEHAAPQEVESTLLEVMIDTYFSCSPLFIGDNLHQRILPSRRSRSPLPHHGYLWETLCPEHGI